MSKKTFFDRLYQIPNELESFEQWLKSNHYDLDDFGQEELEREMARIRFRMTHEDNPDEWLVDRLLIVERRLNVTRKGQ